MEITINELKNKTEVERKYFMDVRVNEKKKIVSIVIKVKETVYLNSGTDRVELFNQEVGILFNVCEFIDNTDKVISTIKNAKIFTNDIIEKIIDIGEKLNVEKVVFSIY
ncbi:MAG: hypothetical protein QXZ22_08605 [Sulfolobales archaeon]